MCSTKSDQFWYCLNPTIQSGHPAIVGWRRGAVGIECRTCDQEVVGSSLGRALGVKLWASSHTYVPLFIKQYKLVPAKGR